MNKKLSLTIGILLLISIITCFVVILCKDKILEKNVISNSDENKESVKIIEKYVGKGSDNASQSYIELYEDESAIVTINNCHGFSRYKAKYYYDTVEYTNEKALVIHEFEILDGDKLDIEYPFYFQYTKDGLFTSWGYIGANQYDCGVSTDFIKEVK